MYTLAILILISLAEVEGFFAASIEPMVRAQSQKKNDAGSSRSKGGAKKMKDLHDLGISCSMQNANPSSKISSGKGKDRKEIIASSSGPKGSSPLRRSTRESPMKKSSRIKF